MMFEASKRRNLASLSCNFSSSRFRSVISRETPNRPMISPAESRKGTLGGEDGPGEAGWRSGSVLVGARFTRLQDGTIARDNFRQGLAGK